MVFDLFFPTKTFDLATSKKFCLGYDANYSESVPETQYTKYLASAHISMVRMQSELITIVLTLHQIFLLTTLSSPSRTNTFK